MADSDTARAYRVAAAPSGYLLIIQKAEPPDVGWFLLAYSLQGDFKGDTWHDSLEDAEDQAKAQYGRVSAPGWREVTGSIEDALAAAKS